jgi:hypothetical protein
VTRTFEARYVLEGNMAKAPLGTTVTINIADEQLSASKSAQVPIGALFDAGKGPGVWVINDNKVSWHPVAIQHINDESAVITSDLQHHDRIVALGAHLLRDGMQVRVANSVAHVAEGASL